MLMKRTQLYIDYETYARAALYAKRLGVTHSDVVRQSLRSRTKLVALRKSTQALVTFSKKYPAPIGTPKDIAVKHDAYLYP